MGVGKLAEAERLLALAQDSVLERWGSNSTQLAEQESMRGMVALERDQPAEAEDLLADAVRIWRSRGAMAIHAWDLCHLAQAQTELQRDHLADANRRECIALLQAQPSANAVPAIAAIVQGALDRSDTIQARAWLAQLPQDKPKAGPELALASARLALLSGQADAADQIVSVLAQLPDDREHRRLRWQALSMQAAQACLSGRSQDGVALRTQTLAEVQRLEPEHLPPEPAPGPAQRGLRDERRLGRFVEGQRWLLQVDVAFARHDLLELGARHRHVALVAADLHLRPVLHRAAVLVHAHHHRRLLAGVADGLDLDQVVGQASRCWLPSNSSPRKSVRRP